jgi:hypothetical protein
MDRREKEEQLRALDELTNLFGINRRFTADDIRMMHKNVAGECLRMGRQISAGEDE